MEATMFFSVLTALILLFAIFFHQHLKNLYKKHDQRLSQTPDIGMILSKKGQAKSPGKYIVVRRGINYFHLKSEISGEHILVSQKKIAQEYQAEV